MTANDRFAWQPYTSCMGAAAVFDATRLAVFREVVRRGSLSAAAQALNFTQPAGHPRDGLDLRVGGGHAVQDRLRVPEELSLIHI